MKPSVVTFSGPIASGKTTLSQEVSKTLGWKYASFGRFIRGEARRRECNSISRELLQEIGNELIKRGWENFCQSVLKDARWTEGEGLVIDGIRHIEVLRTIEEIVAPQNVFLVYILLSEETRKLRLLQKNISINKLQTIESHATEIQVSDILPGIANLSIDGSASVQSNVEIITGWLVKHT